MRVRSASTVAAALLAATALPARGAAGLEIDRSGTYRLQGTARVSARPFLDREVEARADAVLQPGPGPRDVRARLAAEGYDCELLARVERGGALVFEEGQRCAFEVRSDEARGHVDATLRSGRGALRGGDELELDLSWDLAGSLSLQTGRTLDVLGKRVKVPAAWTPEAPVRGNAHATVRGRRDRSRAAER